MKASVSLLLFFLIAAGCTDATNTPTGLTPPDQVFGVVRGNPPPPPVDAVAVVCTDGGCATFDGTYMANSGEAVLTSAIMRAAREEGVCTFTGHAWLKINKLRNPEFTEASNSANAQIKCQKEAATGNGTLEIGGVVVNLEEVDLFQPSADCTANCGSFIIRDEEGNDIATGSIFEREFFDCNDEGEGSGSCELGSGGEG